MLDIIDGRGDAAFGVGDDAVRHIQGREARIEPHHRHHWDIDIGKNVGGGSQNRDRRQKNYDERHHHEGVGTSEG